jgi:hypothetical protein
MGCKYCNSNGGPFCSIVLVQAGVEQLGKASLTEGLTELASSLFEHRYMFVHHWPCAGSSLVHGGLHALQENAATLDVYLSKSFTSGPSHQRSHCRHLPWASSSKSASAISECLH